MPSACEAGKSKTRLAAQLRPFCASDDAVQAIIANFVRAATLDLLQRFAAATASQGGGFECFVTYAPPTEEARSWFASLLQEGRVEDRWRLQPVLSSSSAAVCPASDGGYTLLALPEGAMGGFASPTCAGRRATPASRSSRR